MSPDCFNQQLTRLKNRFGEKAFDQEFVMLMHRETSSMPDYAFVKAVDFMIGSRPPTKPPLIVDFKEARLNEERAAFERTVTKACETMAQAQVSLKEIFERSGYGSCASVADALEIEKTRLQIETANKEGA